jgi:hypothetical protein
VETEFYSCFISYSSKDAAFASRLHAELEKNGVRCWYAPEDIKIGKEFRQTIDDAIREYDKLLLVLSEHSVRSSWVQDEVAQEYPPDVVTADDLLCGRHRAKVIPFPLPSTAKSVRW